MHPAQIAELLQPFLSLASNPCHSQQGRRPSEESAFLSATQLEYISTYIDILQRWSARINLTAIRNEEEIVTRHFGESLFAARHLFPRPDPRWTGREDDWEGDEREGHGFSRADRVSKRSGALAPEVDANAQQPATNDRITVADLGSGAGFPGIPMKLWAPEIALTLIESNHKKATFLREVARALTLTNVNIFPGRAEQLVNAKPAATFDLITLRAVERFADILPVAATLIVPGGRLALLISSSQSTQAHTLAPALSWSEPILVPQSQSRVLLVGKKQ